jgi:predicted ribosomally synthesized peptide with nif11-like leader
MSQEQAKELITRMKSDAAFMERVLAITDIDARMAFINEEGYHCSWADIEQVQNELKAEQIEGAAGGNLLWCSELGLCKHHKTTMCEVG